MDESVRIRIFPSRAVLDSEVVRLIIDAMRTAVSQRGVCVLAVAGGSTPRPVYAALGRQAEDLRTIWRKTHVVLTDERMVPPDHDQSNIGMLKRTLLDTTSIPPENVHRINGEMEPAQAADEFEGELRTLRGGRRRLFDLVLLGVGEDGHTASLFPGTDALHERERLARAVFVPRLDAWRTTLTFPALNSTDRAVFMVSGESKAKVVDRVLHVKDATMELPATAVRPADGEVLWMLDAESASWFVGHRHSRYGSAQEREGQGERRSLSGVAHAEQTHR